MHPSVHALASPDKSAIVMAGSGETVTYAQLDERSNRIAHFFRANKIADGDCVAVILDNTARYFEICWGAQRAGLYYTCVSTKLTVDETAYILRDSGSRMVIACDATIEVAEAAAAMAAIPGYTIGERTGGFGSFQEAVVVQPASPIPDEAFGVEMLYSSGTTGRPKGIKPPRPSGPIAQATGLTAIGVENYGMSADTVYLSPAPLYHAAPLRWCMTVHRLGGTVVVMERFDAKWALELIEKYDVTHAQFVPTHFVRMLKLPPEVRARHDVSSLQNVFHAAAPCPIPIKEQMIEWWGPIIHEYYAGTETNGYTAITSAEWLSHRGSVGRSVWGEALICDEDDNILPARVEGTIFFRNGPSFVYHNDPQKTADATNRHGWTTLGDVGWLDEDGYLYLTDRKSFMIISGGVNIYPQEIENLLITHSKVADAAVVGAPDEEMGEKVVAVVQPADWSDANDDLAIELAAFVRANLSHLKTPRLVDFVRELPRLPTGKLPKRLLRDRYWPQRA